MVLTRQDRVVPPGRQQELADLIPGSVVHEVDAGHGACLNAVEQFLPVLVAACRGVCPPPQVRGQRGRMVSISRA